MLLRLQLLTDCPVLIYRSVAGVGRQGLDARQFLGQGAVQVARERKARFLHQAVDRARREKDLFAVVRAGRARAAARGVRGIGRVERAALAERQVRGATHLWVRPRRGLKQIAQVLDPRERLDVAVQAVGQIEARNVGHHRHERKRQSGRNAYGAPERAQAVARAQLVAQLVELAQHRLQRLEARVVDGDRVQLVRWHVARCHVRCQHSARVRVAVGATVQQAVLAVDLADHEVLGREGPETVFGVRHRRKQLAHRAHYGAVDARVRARELVPAARGKAHHLGLGLGEVRHSRRLRGAERRVVVAVDVRHARRDGDAEHVDGVRVERSTCRHGRRGGGERSEAE